MSDPTPAMGVPGVKPRPLLFWTLMGVYVASLGAIAWMWWTSPKPDLRSEPDGGPVIRLTVPDAAP